MFVKHIRYSPQCSSHNWHYSHFLQLPQLSYFFPKKLMILQLFVFYLCISLHLLICYSQTDRMSLYIVKKCGITKNQRSSQVLHSRYIDITPFIILAVPSSAVFWSISVTVSKSCFENWFVAIPITCVTLTLLNSHRCAISCFRSLIVFIYFFFLLLNHMFIAWDSYNINYPANCLHSFSIASPHLNHIEH